MNVSALMTRGPLPIDAQQSLAEALHRMEGLSFRHLPVIDGHRVVGMLAEAQILRYAREHPAEELDRVLVTQAMGEAFSVTSDAPVRAVARAMVERRLDAAVVMEKERIAGMFTAVDALSALAELDRDDAAPSSWPHKILCAVDFSPGAREAAQAALDLARNSGGAVTLFHAFDLPSSPIDAAHTGAAALAPLEHETDAALAALRADLTRDGGPRVLTAHGLGAAAETVVRHAREHGFDVIVIGTHGRTGIKRAVLGSVAETVVRHAPCPVLVVRR
jgi:universal stress protein A